MDKSDTFKIAIIGVAIALNIVGAFVAFNLKLPIYLDSIGTVFISFLLGPYLGIITGFFSSVVSGLTFDIYSLWFSPVQIFTGLILGVMFKKNLLEGWKILFSVFFATIFISSVGAILTAFIFGGFTSSGSSYIIILLRKLGLGSILSAFLVQFITDYFDKLIAVLFVNKVVKLLKYNKKIVL
ncbi:ECF transporter S component [Clostridium senegalense]|uniref:ECF transporter S component n=1 Tax=Clostridium senegalense TaxID=1465809 RepID=UPI001C0F6A6C|nr:ECF transporter S component [Clostridium senegalense]MBU5226991.1 ECF transporter S component [Clostridium senegalense]